MQNLAVFTNADLENSFQPTKNEKYSKIIKKAHEEEKEIGCCEKIKDYEVRQSFVDFGDLKN